MKLYLLMKILIKNGTLRVMKYFTAFQKDLSTHCGFLVTNTSDIHTIEDVKFKRFREMKTNKSQRSLTIISEIHPQFMGSLSELKRMILQSKIGGADYVKVQLYSSKRLFNTLIESIWKYL